MKTDKHDPERPDSHKQNYENMLRDKHDPERPDSKPEPKKPEQSQDQTKN